jgi:hypothetical protein
VEQVDAARTRLFPTVLFIPILCVLVVIATFVLAPAALCSSDAEGWCDFTVVLIGGPLAAGLAGALGGSLFLGRTGVVIGQVSLVASIVAVVVFESMRGSGNSEPVGWGMLLAITAFTVVLYGTGPILAFGSAYRLSTAIARPRDVHV